MKYIDTINTDEHQLLVSLLTKEHSIAALVGDVKAAELAKRALQHLTDDLCEGCERIDPDDAYQHVCENPPERY